MRAAKSPLARLVLFMICLSMAGFLVSVIHYAAIDMPSQANPPSPKNWNLDCEISNTNMFTCRAMCQNGPVPGVGKESCLADCDRIYQECGKRCPA